MVPKYLDLQTKLYSLCPDLYDKPKKGKKSGRDNKDNGFNDPQAAKIQRKISGIEKDVLFDWEEAEYKWREKLEDLRKEASFFRRTQREEEKPPPVEDQEQPEEIKPEPELESDVLAAAGDNENADLLGDMFGAEEPELESGVILEELSKATMYVRDFGKFSGLSPRRVLEETCKSRYAYLYCYWCFPP